MITYEKEVLQFLVSGKSQSEIARIMCVSRQAIHQTVKELVRSGQINPQNIVRYKRKEEKTQRANLLLTKRYSACREKYLKMYKEGATLKAILDEAKKDKIPRHFRSVNELLEAHGFKRDKGIHAKDLRTGKPLIALFAGKRFVWDSEFSELTLVKRTPLDTPASESKDEMLAARELYDQFCKFAEIKYITYTKWFQHLQKSFKEKTGKRSPWYISVQEFVAFLNEKFSKGSDAFVMPKNEETDVPQNTERSISKEC